MERAARAVDELSDSDEQVQALASALCISMYLQWLGRVSGDLEAEKAARRRYEELQAVLQRRPPTPPAFALRICWGLVLAWSGFRGQAAALLEQNGRTAPEHLLLVLGDDDVRTLATLRPLFTGPAPCRFLPVLHAYGTALVNLGAVHEARALITDGNWDESEALLLDVLASASERLGQWAEAYAAYGRSSWPIHRFRGAMVGAISGQSVEHDELELDEPTRRLIGQFDSELDQNEVTRSIAFLNACLWQPVDDWVVELELGKLNFGRRRYAEADLHLTRSLARAPAGARFAVADLRFVNLTWLTERQPGSELQMTAEALSAGQDALALGTDSDETAGIRTWMARETGDLALLPSSFAGWDSFQRAEAYEVVRQTGLAIDGWLESLSTSFYHRSAWRLMEYLGKGGFTRTATHLANLVMRECHDDFFALWETAQGLQELTPEAQEAGPDDGLDRPDDLYRARLVELSQFEFKNALRAYALVARTEYQDLAEELLLRAAKQAESVSELLAIAVRRRRVQASRATQIDQEGLWCLTRALSEARNRLERLQVARELFHYGRVRDARAVLQDERVFVRDNPLSHIEMVIVLQCAPWLTPEEREDIAERAARRLNLDHRSGALGAYGSTYGMRLVETAKMLDPSLGVRIAGLLDEALTRPPEGTAWPGSTDDDWTSIRGRIDEALDDDEADEAKLDLGALLGSADPASSFGLRLMIASHLRSSLGKLLEEAGQVTPHVPVEEIPVSKGDDRGAWSRTIELCDLWRARLAASEGDAGQAAAAKLRAFFDLEQTLLDRWERSRREASESTLHRAVRAAEAHVSALRTLLGPNELQQTHPVLRSIFEQVGADVEILVEEAEAHVRSARLELPPATSSTVNGSTS
jgi:hypothetical protein